MSIRSLSTGPLKADHPAYRYGMLALILVLLAQNIHLYLGLPPAYRGDPYGNGVVGLMLLFVHLAYWFRWPSAIAVALKFLAWGWLVFGAFYIFYLSHVLYPLPSSP
jgi:hypothetical protein